MNTAPLLLAINTGSSTLKATLYELTGALKAVFTAKAERVGLPNSRLTIDRAAGERPDERQIALADHPAALSALLAVLAERNFGPRLRGAGHRIVHGGPKYTEPERVTAEVLAELRRSVPFAPEHLPQAIAAIETLAEAFPTMPQVVCFDTSFHRTLPPRARLLPIPHELADAGVVRYGFHGLSYEYLVERLGELEPGRAGGRAVLAHLGNGASMAAVDRGISIDTSMGFTPTAGLVMGSRTGDLDPGVLVYLLEHQRLAPAALNTFVNKQCGLLGLSGTSADMRELLAKRGTDERAARAVEIFTYQAKKFVAAYAAALGGLDALVFTGGIGEHAPEIRAEICAGLEFLGVRLDAQKNAAGAPIISAPAASVTVRVIPTDEDLMIARHTRHLLCEGSHDA